MDNEFGDPMRRASTPMGHLSGEDKIKKVQQQYKLDGMKNISYYIDESLNSGNKSVKQLNTGGNDDNMYKSQSELESDKRRNLEYLSGDEHKSIMPSEEPIKTDEMTTKGFIDVNVNENNVDEVNEINDDMPQSISMDNPVMVKTESAIETIGGPDDNDFSL
eukprot:CAMPEP_0114671110 /NCGR_PEP_ID=MMETSP0191-20121206/40601_1 /TAXON_ID=126664 /ORGANISM="Sorites sp." /LENGTH=161 /DNA_ID=CAMNT_0001930167 /DNA_START=448 /DNA_END=933 /DNA_ORIENTATION=-